MGAEKLIERNIRKNLKELGYLTYKIHGGKYGCKGFPDLIVIKDGITSFFEVKAPGGILAPIQLFRLTELRGAGCVAETVQSYSEVQQILRGKKML